MPLLETRERQARDRTMADGLTQTNKIARVSLTDLERVTESLRELDRTIECWRGDMELFRQLDNKQTNKQTYRAIP